VRDGAGLPQHAAKDGKYGAIRSPEVQLANLFAGQDDGRPEFGMRTFKFGHGLDRLAYQAATTSAGPAGGRGLDCPGH